MKLNKTQTFKVHIYDLNRVEKFSDCLAAFLPTLDGIEGILQNHEKAKYTLISGLVYLHTRYQIDAGPEIIYVNGGLATISDNKLKISTLHLIKSDELKNGKEELQKKYENIESTLFKNNFLDSLDGQPIQELVKIDR